MKTLVDFWETLVEDAKTLCRRAVTKLYRQAAKLSSMVGVKTDKVLHFLCSALTMAVCSTFLNPTLSCFITIAIGLLKELYDCHKPNPTGWDWHDLLADLLGMVVVLVVVVFLNV